MSSIPYNYGSYIDAKVAMTDTGHVSAGKQIQSPASAGSRGLAKTTQFSNDKTQMQLGQEAIAESMVEIRSILNRIDGVNAPVQEAESDHLYHNGKEIDQGSIVYDMQDYSDGIFELQSAKYADGTELDEKELEELESTQELIDWVMIDFVSESAVQEDAGEDEKVVDMLRKIKQHLDNHPNMNEHPSLVALDQLADDLESGDKPADYESMQEDIGDKGRIALEKAGFDPMKVKEYMAVFNDHGDTSDIDQMNMDKVGLADAMAMVLASHDVENESAEMSDVNENPETDYEGSMEYEYTGDDGEMAMGTLHYKAINGVVDPKSLRGESEYEGNAKVDDEFATDMVKPGGSDHENALDAAQDDYDYETNRMRSKFEDSGELARLKELSGIEEDAGLTDEQK